MLIILAILSNQHNIRYGKCEKFLSSRKISKFHKFYIHVPATTRVLFYAKIECKRLDKLKVENATGKLPEKLAFKVIS